MSRKNYNKFRDKKEQKETSISYLRHICFAPKIFKIFDNSVLYLVMIIIIIIFCNEK